MKKTKKLRKLIKHAKMGNRNAMYQLGILYQLGKKVPFDMETAAEWISLSAVLGYRPAVEWMEDYAFDDDASVQANS